MVEESYFVGVGVVVRVLVAGEGVLEMRGESGFDLSFERINLFVLY